MTRFAYVTVDVFTDSRFGGNPLAVFPQAAGLPDAAMQALAAEINYAETTFVLPPDDPRNRARVRIFTPRRELPFAGHPNVGTGFVLAAADPAPPEHYTFEEGAGLVRVHPRHDGGRLVGAQVAAPHSLALYEEVETELVAACIGLDPDDIRTTSHTPIVASTGVRQVFVELVDEAALARAAPDAAAFRRMGEHVAEAQSIHMYVPRDGTVARLATRMFAPPLGVPEDPATGSANATLAALLTSLAPGDNVELEFEMVQGEAMGRPSRLYATARKTGEGAVTATIAGGCVPVFSGHVDV